MAVPNRGAAPDLYPANTFIRRLKGLFSKSARQHDGIWIKPCWSVHTFGFPHAIAVYFLDSNNKILKSITPMKKNRVAVCFGATSTVEIYLQNYQPSWKVGDTIHV